MKKEKLLNISDVSSSVMLAAYDVCHEMQFFLGNVIATGDPTESDKLLYKKAKKFCRYYTKHYR